MGTWGCELWYAPEFLNRAHTVKPAHNGFLMVPLFDHKLYVRVFFRDGLEVVEQEGTGVG